MTSSDFKLVIPNENLTEFACYTHSSAKGDYFCITCFNFICKHCYVNEHKSHESNTLSEISASIFSKIKDLEPKVNLDKLSLEEEVHLHEEQNNKFQKLKEDYGRLLKNIGTNFIKVINKRQEKIKKHYLKVFSYYDTEAETKLELDQEIEILLEKLKNKGKKLQDYETKLVGYKEALEMMISYPVEALSWIISERQFFSVIEDLIDIKSDEEICKKLKRYVSILKQKIKEIEETSSDFISNQYYYKDLVDECIENEHCSVRYFLRRFEEFHKKLSENEDSNTNDIKLTHQMYFKKSTISFKVRNKNILLLGLGICGLQVKTLKVKITIVENLAPLLLFSNVNLTNNHVYSEELTLNKITNEDDPVIDVYFKPIKIKKNGYYNISIENLSNDNYISIYLGSTNEKKKIQEIVDPNTNTDFVFFQEKENHSDFDELVTGIICDLWFQET